MVDSRVDRGKACRVDRGKERTDRMTPEWTEVRLGLTGEVQGGQR